MAQTAMYLADHFEVCLQLLSVMLISSAYPIVHFGRPTETWNLKSAFHNIWSLLFLVFLSISVQFYSDLMNDLMKGMQPSVSNDKPVDANSFIE